jgi:2'-5' RNA ligase
MMSVVESALVVTVPEAEPLVASYRIKYDSSAVLGMPAHITILYPFPNLDELNPSDIAAIRALYYKIPGFKAILKEARTFPDTLYLFPEPDERFIKLTEGICRLFPSYEPYGGGYKDIIPHLTVGQARGKDLLLQVVADFKKSSNGRLPVIFEVSEVTLWDNSTGRWNRRLGFPLGRQF